jgi:sugar lactone lactonase YvrE
MKTTTIKTLLAFLFIVYSSSFIVIHCQTITTFAGNGNPGFFGDGGPATSAELWLQNGIVVDHSGNLYIADAGNNVIRKVNTSGIISTFAGNYNYGIGYSGDGGPATSAELSFPMGITMNAAGNLYFSEAGNDIIRMVNSSGIINTVAGNHAYGDGFSGDGGYATNAELYTPVGLAFDSSGNLYIADHTNNMIRKVNTLAIISTFAGIYNGGIGGYSGDGGQASYAELNAPNAVVFDSHGNLYIADEGNNIIRQINTSGTISTIAGNYAYGGGYSGNGGPATTAEMYNPQGLAFDASGNLYIAEVWNSVIRMVNTAGVISTVVGNRVPGYSGDGGPATSAELVFPCALAFDASGSLYISDENRNVIRKVTGLTGINELSDKSNEINVFPNPSSGKFTLELKSEKLKVKNVEVYNVLSEKVYSHSDSYRNQIINPDNYLESNYQIDLSSQPDGIYFLNIQMEDGSVLVKRVEVMR